MIQGEEPPPGGVWVETVGLDAMFQRRGRPVAGGAGGGRGGVRPITLGGVVYPHGIGTQSISEFVIDVKGQAKRFVSMVRRVMECHIEPPGKVHSPTGLIVALAPSRFLSGLLYGMSAGDPVTLTFTALAALVTAALASMRPGR